MPTDLQKKMLLEMEQKTIFRLAQDYAFAYADEVGARRVYPMPEAIADLERFVEELPASTQVTLSHRSFPNSRAKSLSSSGHW